MNGWTDSLHPGASILGGILATFGFALLLRLLRLMILGAPKSAYKVWMTECHLATVDPGGKATHIAWEALQQVTIFTTSDGPWDEDVFWAFYTERDEPALVLPSEVWSGDSLRSLVDHLPGFDDEQLKQAVGSTTDAAFLVWKKPSASVERPVDNRPKLAAQAAAELEVGFEDEHDAVAFADVDPR